MSSGEPLLEARGVRRAFPGVQALDDVDLVVPAGLVTAVVGENGAGKSTLMNILAGVDRAGSRLDGASRGRSWLAPRIDLRCGSRRMPGIAMIHQELDRCAPHLTVTEQHACWGARSPSAVVCLSSGDATERTWPASARDALAHDRDSARSVAEIRRHVPAAHRRQQQLVEIANAHWLVRRGCLVMDEPTTSSDWIKRGRRAAVFEVIERVACGPRSPSSVISHQPLSSKKSEQHRGPVRRSCAMVAASWRGEVDDAIDRSDQWVEAHGRSSGHRGATHRVALWGRRHLRSHPAWSVRGLHGADAWPIDCCRSTCRCGAARFVGHRGAAWAPVAPNFVRGVVRCLDPIQQGHVAVAAVEVGRATPRSGGTSRVSSVSAMWRSGVWHCVSEDRKARRSACSNRSGSATTSTLTDLDAFVPTCGPAGSASAGWQRRPCAGSSRSPGSSG